MDTKKKRPADINVLAKSIVDQTTQENEPSITPTTEPIREKNAAAVALGRLGGLKGGKARARKLSSKRRRAIATKAAKARWKKDK